MSDDREDIDDENPKGPQRLRHYGSGEERRAAIAAAARDIIAEKGFEGLRTRDIAARVGINVATLHYHVPSKDALIELLTAFMREEFVQEYRRRDRSQLTPPEELRLEMTEFLETRIRNPNLLEAMSELAQRARRDDNVARHVVAMRTGWNATIAGIIARGMEQGVFRRDIDPPSAALIVTSVIGSFQHLTPSEMTRIHAVADELIRSLLSRSPSEVSDATE